MTHGTLLFNNCKTDDDWWPMKHRFSFNANIYKIFETSTQFQTNANKAIKAVSKLWHHSLYGVWIYLPIIPCSHTIRRRHFVVNVHRFYWWALYLPICDKGAGGEGLRDKRALKYLFMPFIVVPGIKTGSARDVLDVISAGFVWRNISLAHKPVSGSF